MPARRVGHGSSSVRQNFDPVTGRETVETGMTSSVYLDRGGSVLASVNWSQQDHRLISMNLDPGVLHPALGAWFVVRQDWAIEFGLTQDSALRVGLGAGVGR